VEFFCELEPPLTVPLKLMRVENDQVWGISSEPSSGQCGELVEIARLASLPLQLGLYYGFFSVPCSYACQLFEAGQLTHQQHHLPEQDTWTFSTNVEPLGLDSSLDWDRELETLFRDTHDKILLEH